MSTEPDSIPNFEFTPQQSQVMGRLAAFMRGLAFILVFLGLVQFIMGLKNLPQGAVLWIQAAVFLAVGILHLNAAAAFRRVAETEGDDVRRLMDALGGLLNRYRLQVILFLVAVLALVLVVLMALFVNA